MQEGWIRIPATGEVPSRSLHASGLAIFTAESWSSIGRQREKAACDAQAKIDGIAAAVFDLEAVNPNAIVKIDERTPEEVIRSIEDQGRIVADALTNLRTLLQNGRKRLPFEQR